MVRYEKYILNKLLNSYEDSCLFARKNKVNVRIAFSFTTKNIPDYFDESSVCYEEIHAAMQLLERKEYIIIQWKKGNHIIQKVLLNDLKIEEIYQYIQRKPKSLHIEKTLQLLEEFKEKSQGHVNKVFIGYLSNRIQEGESVKEFIDLSDYDRTKRLLQAINWIEKNQETRYIREFSIRHFGDSKIFEEMLAVIGKVFKRFEERFAKLDVYAILAEYSIYHTPDYVYIKGSSGIVRIGKSQIVLEDWQQGIGICGEDLQKIKFGETLQIQKVITIENLTTFFRWKEEASLLIYLGGYHNGSRRSLLKLIHEQIPQAQYLHFGDIDVGGFEIYEDLKRQTGILFQTYYMDLQTLKKYEIYAKNLTANDRKRLKKVLDFEGENTYQDVLEYMLAQNVKLEQECVEGNTGESKDYRGV